MITNGESAEVERESVRGFKGVCAFVQLFRPHQINPIDVARIDSAHTVVHWKKSQVRFVRILYVFSEIYVL
jgi:hypothetical protein